MLCLGGKGYPEMESREPEVETLTNQLVYDARTAVHEVFATSRSSVRRVRESQQLDQEEALAYVLAHLLGHQIMGEEARKIGELARHAAVAFKGKPPGVKGKPPKPPADQVLIRTTPRRRRARRRRTRRRTRRSLTAWPSASPTSTLSSPRTGASSPPLPCSCRGRHAAA